MTKIRTAEEVIFQKQITAKHPNFTIEEISEMMQEYAKQFLDRAAEEAEVKYVYLPRDDERQAIVDTESILKLKEMVK